MTGSPADFLVPSLALLAALAGAATTLELPQTIVGWLGIAGTILGAFALYRAGSVRAWKETAEGRGFRITDLERELAELRAELAIPERIEGIVRLMADTAERQEIAAAERAETALRRVEVRWELHDVAAEKRTSRLEAAINNRRETTT